MSSASASSRAHMEALLTHALKRYVGRAGSVEPARHSPRHSRYRRCQAKQTQQELAAVRISDLARSGCRPIRRGGEKRGERRVRGRLAQHFSHA
eukprot:6212969-Pleurochrysis_carterae.AAC.1